MGVDETKDALWRARNSAAGPDRIRYENIAKLPDGELDELVSMYNSNIENAEISIVRARVEIRLLGNLIHNLTVLEGSAAIRRHRSTP